MVPTVPYDIQVQVPVNHDFSDTFESDKSDGETVGKVEFNDFVTHLCKLQSHNLLAFFLYFHLFYTNYKSMYQPCVNGSPNP